MQEVVIEVLRLDGGSLQIRHAAEMAQVFFRLDPSANGPNAFDDLVDQARQDRIEESDIKVVNTTMAARTPKHLWEDLFSQAHNFRDHVQKDFLLDHRPGEQAML